MGNKPRTNVSRVAVGIVIVTLITKFFGAGRDLVLSYYYGSTAISDAYLLATTLPVTIFSFIYEGIGSSYIPACSRLNDEKQRNYLTCNVINTVLIVSVIVILIIDVFPETVIKVFASGFGNETMSISIYILRISIIGVVFSAVSYVIVYYLNYHNKFYIPAARALPMDIVVIISIIISAKYNNLFLLALGIPVSLMVSFFFMIPQSKSVGLKYSLVLNFHDPNLKAVFKWSVPVIISTALIDINSIVDRQFASRIMIGGISVITYASRLSSIINSLLFVPVLSVMFPSFSKGIAEGKKQQISDNAYDVLVLMLLFSLPITVGAILLSKDLITIIFQRGAFDVSSTQYTAECFTFYSLSIIAYSITVVTTKLFYSDTDMWTPMRVSAIGVGINIIGNITFAKILGISGLALASGITALLVSVIQLIIIIKRFNMPYMRFLFYLIRIGIASCGMGVFVYVLKHIKYLSEQHSMVIVIFSMIMSVLCYYALLKILRVEELRYYEDKLYSVLKSPIERRRGK